MCIHTHIYIYIHTQFTSIVIAHTDIDIDASGQMNYMNKVYSNIRLHKVYSHKY